MQYAEIIIGAVCTIVGVLLSYAAFARNSKKDSEASGKESGTVHKGRGRPYRAETGRAGREVYHYGGARYRRRELRETGSQAYRPARGARERPFFGGGSQ